MRFEVALVVLLLWGAGCVGSPSRSLDSTSNSTASSSPLPFNLTGNNTDDGITPRNATLDEMPHMHDYWKGRERVTLVDTDLDLEVLERATFVSLFVERRPGFGGGVLFLPDGATVYEGTGKMEILVTWTDPTITGLALRYRSAASPDLSDLIPLESGKPLTLEVTPEMTDMPHSSSSRWLFFFEAWGPSGVGVAQGQAHVKIDIVRVSNIALFPPHPKYFVNGTSLLLHDKEFTSRGETFVSRVQNPSQDPPTIVPDHPVPMESKVLLVRLDVSQATSSNPLSDTSDIRLLYHGADTSSRWISVSPAHHEGKVYVFSIPVQMRQGDSYYAQKSQWEFYPVLNDNVGGTRLQCGFGGCFDWEIQGRAKIVAFSTNVTADSIL